MPLDHLPNRKTPPNCMPNMYHKKPQKLPSVSTEALLKLIKLTVLSFFPAALRHLAVSEPTRHKLCAVEAPPKQENSHFASVPQAYHHCVAGLLAASSNNNNNNNKRHIISRWQATAGKKTWKKLKTVFF